MAAFRDIITTFFMLFLSVRRETRIDKYARLFAAHSTIILLPFGRKSFYKKFFDIFFQTLLTQRQNVCYIIIDTVSE